MRTGLNWRGCHDYGHDTSVTPGQQTRRPPKRLRHLVSADPSFVRSEVCACSAATGYPGSFSAPSAASVKLLPRTVRGLLEDEIEAPVGSDESAVSWFVGGDDCVPDVGALRVSPELGPDFIDLPLKSRLVTETAVRLVLQHQRRFVLGEAHGPRPKDLDHFAGWKTHLRERRLARTATREKENHREGLSFHRWRAVQRPSLAAAGHCCASRSRPKEPTPPVGTRAGRPRGPARLGGQPGPDPSAAARR